MELRWQNRAPLARMVSADMVRMKDLDWALGWSMQVWMAASSSAVLVNTPPCRRRRVRSANRPSTRLSHEAEAGVKCRCQRGRLSGQSRMILVLGVAALSSAR